MKFLPSKQLYSNTENCLRYLRELTVDTEYTVPRKAERYHMYWYGIFSSKQAFAIKSFLATQDLESSELWLWLDIENGHTGHQDNPLLQPFMNHIQVNCFDPKTESLNTPLENMSNLFTGVSPASRSDFSRHVILYNYGGVYVDMDTMFLRDMNSLLRNKLFDREFCYRWSAHQSYGNSAVLRIHQKSEVGFKLLVRCREVGSCHPRIVLRFEDNTDLDLTVLPCVFFDPLWPHHDHKDKYNSAPFNRFDDFFRKFDWNFTQNRNLRSYRDFFPGAFTYQWHNFWNAREYSESYFGVFNRELNNILHDKLGIDIPCPSDADCTGTIPVGNQ